VLSNNKNTLINISISFVAAQLLLTTLFFYEAKQHVRDDAEYSIQQLLRTHDAIHSYVEEIQMPEIYRLQEEGKLHREYFSSEIMSFIYVTRGITKYLNEERLKKGLPPIYFKLASTNPLNLNNTADSEEALLLEKMKQGLTTEYREYSNIDGEPYLHFAMPITANKTSCMRCHGTPSSAPKELLALYGENHGFYENVGDIRALISIRLPLSTWYSEHYHDAVINSLTALLTFALIYLIVVHLIRRIDNQETAITTAKDVAILNAEKKSQLLRNIINSMPSILIGCDEQGQINLWNSQAEISSGVTYKSATGSSLWDHCPSLIGVEERIKETLEERGELQIEKLPHMHNGEIEYLDIMVYPLGDQHGEGAVIRVDNVTERARMEDIMVQTEKMMSVGGLAAGMAHEINNPLGGILQGTQNLERRLSPDLKANIKAAQESGTSLEAIHSYMENRGLFKFIEGIRESGLRASKIVENMLSFSRKADSSLKACALNAILDQTIELAWNDYDLKKKFDFRNIEIIKQYDMSIPDVPCAESEIEQVILNLLKNASQAIADAQEHHDLPQILLRTMVRDNMVVIEVEDNGPGIEPSVRKRIFEPFFTTKEVGVGTGLGLSVSYFIITENHSGSMSVSSIPGKGTTFTIELPIKGKTE
jgi:PAS domain S-box-containing protein